MKYIVAEISDRAVYVAAGLTPPSPDEIEFRERFGREPDDADRALGLTRLIEVARAIQGGG
jgi:hypothetical protein